MSLYGRTLNHNMVFLISWKYFVGELKCDSMLSGYIQVLHISAFVQCVLERCYTVILLYLHSLLLECHQYLSPALIFKSIGDSICTSGEFSNIKPNIESCSLFLFSSLWEISKLSKGKFQGHRHRVVLGFHVFSDWPGIQDKFNMNTFLHFIFLILIFLQKSLITCF